MSTSDKRIAAAYRYDPLDRLSTSNASQRFYQENRISAEIEGATTQRFFKHDAQPLAQQQHGATPGTTLLATDQQTSVLHSVSPTDNQPRAYTPYGHQAAGNGLLSLLGFNGERPEPVTGHYLLGQGYRAFNPLLMRFNSPDSWSPFGDGGVNAYAYCDNNPLNKTDPTGHMANILKPLFRTIGAIKTSEETTSLLMEKLKFLNKHLNDRNVIGRNRIPENSLNQSTSRLINRALKEEKKGLPMLQKADKLNTKIGYNTQPRHAMDPNTLFRKRGTDANPIRVPNRTTERAHANSLIAQANELVKKGTTHLLKAEQHITTALIIRGVL